MKFYIIQNIEDPNKYISYFRTQKSIHTDNYGSFKDHKKYGSCWSEGDAMIFHSKEEAKKFADTYLPEGKAYKLIECTGVII